MFFALSKRLTKRILLACLKIGSFFADFIVDINSQSNLTKLVFLPSLLIQMAQKRIYHPLTSTPMGTLLQ